MKVTILGCGASGGTPTIGGVDGMGDWGICDQNNSKNLRLRASILVELNNTKIIVDSSPDLRTQCLANGIDKIDGVLFTHDHADHTHGIDELRRLSFSTGSIIQIYGTNDTLVNLKNRFSYAFKERTAGYPPFINANNISDTDPFSIKDINVIPYPQNHGLSISIGYRFDTIAYSTDLISLPNESYKCLSGIDILIIDALRYNPHPTHANVKTALSMIERIQPKRAILTHMSPDLDYQKLLEQLPESIEPAYDGMVIDLN